jgi:O-antigen/teichoic acid export membrane protein
LTKTKLNLLANIGGQAWAGLMSIVFIPVYIKLLGVEAYGVLSLYVVLLAGLALLDMGLSSAVIRYFSISQLVVKPAEILRSLEWVFWPAAVLIAVICYFASGSLARAWLNPITLTESQLQNTLALMGLTVAVQWPAMLYSAALYGLQNHVPLNWLLVAVSTLRGAGVLVAMDWFGASLDVFLWFQTCVSAIHTVALLVLSWRLVGGVTETRFSARALAHIAPFATGVGFSAVIAFGLMQSDKLILSSTIDLVSYGQYALAATVASVLFKVISPIYATFYPRFSQLVAQKDLTGLSSLYHNASQLMVVALIPLALVIAFFAPDILFIWTTNAAIAAHAAPFLVFLVIGNALNGLMNLPYALQLAHGVTKLSLWQATIAIIVFIPSAYAIAAAYGGIGVAALWAALNLALICVGIPLMHRSIQKGHLKEWLIKDTLLPISLGTVACASLRFLVIDLGSGFRGFMSLVIIYLFVACVTLAASASLRSWLILRLSQVMRNSSQQ